MISPTPAHLIAGACLGLTAQAGGVQQPMGGEEHLSVRAMTDHSSLRPGDSGLLAVELTVDEGWHTYWPGVSDSGYGVSIDVDAPPTITLAQPVWPSPKRYLQKGGILDHTYEGTQLVVIPFTISGDAPAGDVAVFSVDVSFLVCEEVCLPGRQSTTASLSLIDAQSDKTASADHGPITEAFAKRAREFDAGAGDVRLQWIAKAAAIMFRDATRIEFYPDTECSTLAEPIEDGAAQGNRLEIRFTDKQDKVLSGRVRVTTRDGVVDYDIHETAP